MILINDKIFSIENTGILSNITIIEKDYHQEQEDTAKFYRLMKVEKVNVDGAMDEYRLYDANDNLIAELNKINIEEVELSGDELERWYANTVYRPEDGDREYFNFLKI